MKRRKFIKNVAIGSTAIVLPLSLSAFGAKNKSLKFGVCADVHKDIMHDSDERLSEFVAKAGNNKADFIIQLGDFCRPYDYNLDFLSIWRSFGVNNHHVIGNHEMDGGFSRQQVVEYLGMPNRFYSFDTNGFHIIVLDGNDKNPSENRAPGYARFIGDTQLNWLKEDLQSTDLPCLVFSHQSFEKNDDGIENRKEIRALFEAENKNAGFKKVIAAFSGHHHTDYVAEINGIYYIQINSMSYQWLGDKYKTIRYSKEIDKKFPWIKYTVPYKEPLYAFVEISNGAIKIEGTNSSFIEPSPKELGCPEPPVNNPTVPFISDRKLKLKNQ